MLLLFCTLPATGQAEWKLQSATRESSLNEPVEHWKTELRDEASGQRATLHSALFSTRAATFQVIDQPTAPRRSLAEVLQETKALAGVNGGYFDPENAPVGLLVSDGRVVSPQSKAKLLSGILFARGNRVDIVRASAFSLGKKTRAARQCGPLLVERGRAVAGLNESRPARRTFVAVDGKGHVLLGVSSSVSLAQLGQILSLTNAAGQMKVARALNLDGGSSSAFCFDGPAGAFSQRSLKPVRDFIAIVPRSDR